MSKLVELISVFIASPGGLDRERKAFRRALLNFNEDDAHARGFAFAPLGGNTAAEQAMRGQDAINAEVRRSDYLVLVLHDRWGTPTGRDGFSSGTEEEYAVARECLLDPDMPMRDIVVLFKGVQPPQLNDPGDQLVQVLAFRRRIEEEHNLFYGRFDKVSEFDRKINRHLHRWVREREDGSAGVRGGEDSPAPPPPAPQRRWQPPPDSGDVVVVARDLSKRGLHVEAETLLAPQASEDGTSAASAEYARVLRRAGRTALAVETSSKLLKIAIEAQDHDRVLDHYGNLALSLRRRGEIEQSLRTWRKAITYGKKLGPPYQERVAFLLDNLGVTARKAGKTADARAALQEAVLIRQRTDNRRGLAHSYTNLGMVERDEGNLEAAEAVQRTAMQLFEDTNDIEGEAAAAGRLAAIIEQRGDSSEARLLYGRALQLSHDRGDRRGEAIAHAQLARSFLDRGDVEQAVREATESLVLNEQLDDSVGLATSLELMGRIRVANKDLEGAIEVFDEAFRLFSSAGYQLGATGVLLRAAAVHLSLGEIETVAEILDDVDSRQASDPLPRLKGELDDLKKKLKKAEAKRARQT